MTLASLSFISSLSHSLFLSLSPSLSISISLSLSLSLSLFPSLPLLHSFSHSLSLTLIHTHTHTCSIHTITIIKHLCTHLQTTHTLPIQRKYHTLRTHTTTASKHKLSMLLGVTVPCILSIFSVILFLRLGFVLGNVSPLLVYINSFVSLCFQYCHCLSLELSDCTMHYHNYMYSIIIVILLGQLFLIIYIPYHCCIATVAWVYYYKGI